ncbi:MAG: DNA-binding response regulator [Armatimonadetes bacterium]|jgi:two-component system KDP operon response regulator KdpE|nr:DNA-binding response regulator [Armatimonadota bacterium]
MRVLVIDDEPQIRRALRAGLEQNGYQVSLAAAGEAGLDEAALHPPDLVILDLAMPGMDGFEVCRQLREWTKAPIIILSVREDETDKIRALDLGADDYLTKPFSLGELLARLRAVLRRATGDTDEEPPSFSTGVLSIDFARRKVLVAGQEVHLTPKEFALLRYMALNPERVLTHRQLLTRVWGAEYAEDTHTLRVHLANLRTKIEPEPARPQFIQTEPRIGYRFRLSEG